MMMVVAVMAVALHLKMSLWKLFSFVKRGLMNFVVGSSDLRAELGMFFSIRMAAATAAMMLAVSPLLVPVRAGEPVDINRASVAELMQVSGMTESWAKRIVRFRPYRSKLDLLNEGVVSAEVYRRIRDGVVAHRVKDGKST